MSDFSTDGIVLKKTEYGDHDLIITFYTRSLGRVSVIAKNAKKSVRRFGGALDSFSVMNIECSRQKRRNGLPVLCSVDLTNPFSRIRTNALHTGYASYWVEIINSWMEEGKEQEDIYRLLFYVLETLNSGTLETSVLSLLFQIRFMSLSGFSPDLARCGICSQPIDELPQQTLLFDLPEGRLVCEACSKKTAVRNGIVVSKGTLKQLHWINTKDINRVERMRFSDLAINEGERLLELFIPFHLGREMKSLGVLRRIRQG